MSALPVQFDIVRFFTDRRERARLLRREEVIPSSLEAGFDILNQLDPEWVWVLEVQGEIRGVLIASPAHGAAMIWRISIGKNASSMALGRLLRAFMRDMRRRGIKGYVTCLSPERENEMRLKKIMEHSGGFQVGKESLVLMASPLPRENI